MAWTVYILECADTSLYTGITVDLARRLDEHSKGKGAKYTKHRGPFSPSSYPHCHPESPRKI